MSWDEELWVAVSLIQSAPHRAVQYTASVLIVRYAFPPMHNCFRSPFLSTYSSSKRESHTCELIHTHKVPLCCSQTSTHYEPYNHHVYAHNSFSSYVSDTRTQIHLLIELSANSGLYIFFTNILFCHGALIWADLYCAVCCWWTFNGTVGRQFKVLWTELHFKLNSVLTYVSVTWFW